jgi:predicted Rossmann fold flavoprotein
VKHTFDAIVLGAGAAGLMAAIEAGKRGRRVGVLEHADRIGKKILISGGGRCNFTNLHCQPDHFLSANPHFVKSALARYTPADFISLVEKHRIAYHEKTLGQLFCDGSAQQIVSMLEEECRAAAVQIFTKTSVHEVARPDRFVLRTGEHEFHAPVLVVATGGLSIPKMGATGIAYDIARQFGLCVRECRPALVPLLLSARDRERYCDLAGVSTEVTTAVRRRQFREKMLITHHGLSGPAILQISLYWDGAEPIVIDLSPGREVTAPLLQPGARRDAMALRAAFRDGLPNRLADRWLENHAPSGWNNHALADLERRVHQWEVVPSGTEGFERAEVTAGGIDTLDLSAKTVEARKVPGLYFVGEAVDVTGHLGGFNLHWAWASGFCAGRAI